MDSYNLNIIKYKLIYIISFTTYFFFSRMTSQNQRSSRASRPRVLRARPPVAPWGRNSGSDNPPLIYLCNVLLMYYMKHLNWLLNKQSWKKNIVVFPLNRCYNQRCESFLLWFHTYTVLFTPIRLYIISGTKRPMPSYTNISGTNW